MACGMRDAKHAAARPADEQTSEQAGETFNDGEAWLWDEAKATR